MSNQSSQSSLDQSGPSMLGPHASQNHHMDLKQGQKLANAGGHLHGSGPLLGKSPLDAVHLPPPGPPLLQGRIPLADHTNMYRTPQSIQRPASAAAVTRGSSIPQSLKDSTLHRGHSSADLSLGSALDIPFLNQPWQESWGAGIDNLLMSPNASPIVEGPSSAPMRQLGEPTPTRVERPASAPSFSDSSGGPVYSTFSTFKHASEPALNTNALIDTPQDMHDSRSGQPAPRKRIHRKKDKKPASLDVDLSDEAASKQYQESQQQFQIRQQQFQNHTHPFLGPPPPAPAVLLGLTRATGSSPASAGSQSQQDIFDNDGEEIPAPENMPVVEDDGSKPPYSYAALIGMAILRAPERKLTLSQIYSWITDTFEWYRNSKPTWNNSIRHNLSLNKAFVKQQRPKDDAGKGHYWTIKEGHEAQFFKPKGPKGSIASLLPTVNSSTASSPPHSSLTAADLQFASPSRPAKRRAKRAPKPPLPTALPEFEDLLIPGLGEGADDASHLQLQFASHNTTPIHHDVQHTSFALHRDDSGIGSLHGAAPHESTDDEPLQSSSPQGPTPGTETPARSRPAAHLQNHSHSQAHEQAADAALNAFSTPLVGHKSNAATRESIGGDDGNSSGDSKTKPSASVASKAPAKRRRHDLDASSVPLQPPIRMPVLGDGLSGGTPTNNSPAALQSHRATIRRMTMHPTLSQQPLGLPFNLTPDFGSPTRASSAPTDHGGPFEAGPAKHPGGSTDLSPGDHAYTSTHSNGALLGSGLDTSPRNILTPIRRVFDTPIRDQTSAFSPFKEDTMHGSPRRRS